MPQQTPMKAFIFQHYLHSCSHSAGENKKIHTRMYVECEILEMQWTIQKHLCRSVSTS